jgi:CBS domain containing-hemolysin-like protein
LLRIDEVAIETGYRAPEGPYETIGGLLLQEIGHIPVVGESAQLPALDPDGLLDDAVCWQATVVRMDGRRIDLLELTELTGCAETSAERPPGG